MILSGTTKINNQEAGTRRNSDPLTPIVVINHPLSASSIYYNPWHPPCSIYMPDKNVVNITVYYSAVTHVTDVYLYWTSSHKVP